MIEPDRLDLGQIEYKEFHMFVILGFGSAQSSGKGSFPDYVNNDKCDNKWSEHVNTSVLCISFYGTSNGSVLA